MHHPSQHMATTPPSMRPSRATVPPRQHLHNCRPIKMTGTGRRPTGLGLLHLTGAKPRADVPRRHRRCPPSTHPRACVRRRGRGAKDATFLCCRHVPIEHTHLYHVRVEVDPLDRAPRTTAEGAVVIPTAATTASGPNMMKETSPPPSSRSLGPSTTRLGNGDGEARERRERWR